MNRPWTGSDLLTLASHAHLGAAHLAELLNRTTTAVERAAARHHISLRRPGERRGRVQGEATPGTFSPALRAAMLNPATARRLMADATAILAGNLCPACATRPTRPGHDHCDYCELTALTEAYEAYTAALVARKANAAARKRRSRALADTEAEGHG